MEQARNSGSEQDAEGEIFYVNLLKKENNNHEWKNRNSFWSGC